MKNTILRKLLFQSKNDEVSVMDEEIRYSIRKVSEICNISSKTLRYYDEIQLVVPEFRDDTNRYRYYSKKQMVTLAIIRRLRSMDFALKEIQSILSENNTNRLEQSIEMKLEDIKKEIDGLQIKYSETHSFLQRLRTGVDLLNIKDVLSGDEISVVTIPKCDVIYTKQTMKNYANTEVSLDRWLEIVDMCEQYQLKSQGAVIVTYNANPLEQFLFSDLDIEFCMPVEATKEGDCYKTYGGFLAATAIHIGNYRDIIETHIRLIRWINQNQYKIVGNVSEEFIISPLDVDNVDEHVTKILVPVVAVGAKE